MANKSHRRYVAPNKRYLQATGASLNDGQENDVSITGHGTGILAKAVGWKHGVAKRSKPVIVRVSKKGDPGAWLNGVQVSLLGIRIPLSISNRELRDMFLEWSPCGVTYFLDMSHHS